MIFCEHLESIFGGAKTCSPCSCKSCDGYLKGTLDYGLYYTGDCDFRLFGSTDLDCLALL
jgi:hypothetical protein